MFQPTRSWAFLKSIMSNSGAYTKLRIEPFISSTGVDGSYSVNHDWLHVFSDNNYHLLSYLSVELNLGLPDDFTQEHFQNNTLSIAPGSRIRRNAPEEGRRAYRPKRCEYNHEDEDISPNILSDKKKSFRSHLSSSVHMYQSHWR